MAIEPVVAHYCYAEVRGPRTKGTKDTRKYYFGTRRRWIGLSEGDVNLVRRRRIIFANALGDRLPPISSQDGRFSISPAAAAKNVRPKTCHPNPVAPPRVPATGPRKDVDNPSLCRRPD